MFVRFWFAQRNQQKGRSARVKAIQTIRKFSSIAHVFSLLGRCSLAPKNVRHVDLSHTSNSLRRTLGQFEPHM